MVKTQKYLSNVEESIELEKKTYSIKKKLDKKNIQEGEKLLIFKFPLTELKGQIEMYVERERESKYPTERASHHQDYFFPQS